MDGERIDRWARVVATRGAGRRDALRLLGATAAGWLALLARRGTLAAQDAPPAAAGCRQDGDCVDPDRDPCTGARCEGGACTFSSVLCAPGFVCCGNGECCLEDDTGPGQCASDADCADGDADPCTGVRCEAGSCAPYILTCADGFACCGGECVAVCAGGQGFDADCRCPGGPPTDGGGTDETGGAPAGGSGSGAGNAVQPIQLPNTGVGRATPGPRLPIAPLAGLTAAAALVVDRIRRRTT